ncbi:Hypothetical predicted protein [Olea europaea subsp. europaea]|uniref:Uncharacterized protein n=1 Tax=Olea europaea subsp. europaea TaxID=158383 RepID=A0A8S0VJ91_OLEEU|nr:Hypothetical predicted protein [Olea europaea subsp. europaea]
MSAPCLSVVWCVISRTSTFLSLELELELLEKKALVECAKFLSNFQHQDLPFVIHFYDKKVAQHQAQKLLDDILERTIEVVRHTDQPISEKDPTIIEGVRLFKHAPRGIVFDHLDELEGPKKKPRILPGEEVDEKSKTFRKQVQSIAIDGTDIIAAATAACKKSLSKLEAREADAKAAAKREEERVAKMKSVRGERWLPSMAREMQTKTQCPR